MQKILISFFYTPLFTNYTKSKPEIKTKISTINQQKDNTNFKDVFNTALIEGKSYEWFKKLTKYKDGRLSGLPQAAKAIIWVEKEEIYFCFNAKKKKAAICALGFSIAT